MFLKICASFLISFVATQDVGLNVIEMIRKHGYPCEIHYITTEDGYILGFQRIPYGKNGRNIEKRPAVLIMHSLLTSSAEFVEMGAERSLGFLLADRGYDVWLGNTRGNKWSRNHTKLDIEKEPEKWFDFSWHETGYYDLPAAIDYILNIVKDNQLFYIGFSQGGTSFFVMGSTRPEYNTKIKLALLLAPPAYMRNVRMPIVSSISSYIYEVEKLANQLGFYEVPFVDVITSITPYLCMQPIFSDICILIVFGLTGTRVDINTLLAFTTNTPSNAPLKQIYHYGQLIQTGNFAYYNHGRDKNIQIYGTESPPIYNLSLISTPVAFYYGPNDIFVPPKDAQITMKLLPNVVLDYMVPDKFFGHVDFTYNKNVVNLVYNQMIRTMEQYK